MYLKKHQTPTDALDFLSLIITMIKSRNVLDRRRLNRLVFSTNSKKSMRIRLPIFKKESIN